MTNYRTSEEIRISLLELIDIIFSNGNVNDVILNTYVSKHFILTVYIYMFVCLIIYCMYSY